MSPQTYLTLASCTIIALMTIIHFTKNQSFYSPRNKMALPICYTLSVTFLFAIGNLSWQYTTPFVLITLLKCLWLNDHVSQMQFDFSNIPLLKKNPTAYIVFNDAMALFLIALTKIPSLVMRSA